MQSLTSRAAKPAPWLRSGQARLVGYAAANVFGVAGPEIWAPSRRQARVAHARQTAAYLTHVGFNMPLVHVAEAFGRHRTTIGHACAFIEDSRDHQRLDHGLSLLEAALRAHAITFFAADQGEDQ